MNKIKIIKVILATLVLIFSVIIIGCFYKDLIFPRNYRLELKDNEILMASDNKLEILLEIEITDKEEKSLKLLNDYVVGNGDVKTRKINIKEIQAEYPDIIKDTDIIKNVHRVYDLGFFLGVLFVVGIIVCILYIFIKYIKYVLVK